MSGSDENAVENNLVIHVLAPLAAIGATWVVRKALDTSYRSITGHTAPKSALAWAAVTAASAAVVEVAVFRLLAKRG
jgi:hypothetical protein